MNEIGVGVNLKPSIYISRSIPKNIIDQYASKLDIHMWEHEAVPIPHTTLMEKAQQVDGLICMLSDQIDEAFLAANSHLKVVSNLAVGYDNIDVAAATAQGTVITNTPDVLTETTADLGFALLMATARRIPEATNLIKNNGWKEWSPYFMAGADIHHKTIGIYGMGRIGEAIAKRAKGFDMNVLYHNRRRNKTAEKAIGASYVSIEQLLKESDFVVSVVPLTPETSHTFNTKAFQLMKESAIFINISRGKVVDETALLHALETGKIRGAGLDVFDQEPIDGSHPLLKLEQVVCLLHIGSASEETRTAMIKLCLDNCCSVLYGADARTPVLDK